LAVVAGTGHGAADDGNPAKDVVSVNAAETEFVPDNRPVMSVQRRDEFIRPIQGHGC
jgi:hypothetical protein